MRRKLIPLLLFFIVLPVGGLVYSVYMMKTQSEYQMPNRPSTQQVQRKQPMQQAQRQQSAQSDQLDNPAQRAQSKQSVQQAQRKQTVQPDQMDNPAQRAQGKQPARQAKGKQSAQQVQSKQPAQQVQSAPRQQESLPFPAYSEFSTRKRSAQQIQNGAERNASHSSSAYSMYKTSKHNVHQVQGGYMQAATSDVPFHPMRGQRIMTTGAVYASTVYVPFDSKTPASYSEDLAMADRGLRRAKQDFIQRPDDIPAQTSPVGEPWILLVFALLFGGVVALRRRNRGASRVHRGNHVSYHTL